MGIFDKKYTIKIEKDDLNDAQLSTVGFDENIKKRAFLNVLSARVAMKMLFSNDIAADNVYSLYTIQNVLKRLDISDIYCDSTKLDIRMIFNREQIFIPKSQFENSILPDLYLFFELSSDMSSAEFIGLITPDKINKANSNDLYYFVEQNELISCDELENMISSIPKKSRENIQNAEIEIAQEQFLALTDNEISDKKLKQLIKLLANSYALRESLVEFENFELISSKAAVDENILNDAVLGIVGAQNVHEDDEEPVNEKAEIIDSVLTDLIENEELKDEQEKSANSAIGGAIAGMVAGAAAGAATAGIAASAAGAAGLANVAAGDLAANAIGAAVGGAIDGLSKISSAAKNDEDIDFLNELTENSTLSDSNKNSEENKNNEESNDIESNDVELEDIEPEVSDLENVELDNLETDNLELKDVEQETLDVVESNDVELEDVEPKVSDLENVELDNLETDNLELKDAEQETLDAIESNDVEIEDIEPVVSDLENVELDNLETDNLELKDVEQNDTDLSSSDDDDLDDLDDLESLVSEEFKVSSEDDLTTDADEQLSNDINDSFEALIQEDNLSLDVNDTENTSEIADDAMLPLEDVEIKDTLQEEIALDNLSADNNEEVASLEDVSDAPEKLEALEEVNTTDTTTEEDVQLEDIGFSDTLEELGTLEDITPTDTPAEEDVQLEDIGFADTLEELGTLEEITTTDAPAEEDVQLEDIGFADTLEELGTLEDITPTDTPAEEETVSLENIGFADTSDELEPLEEVAPESANTDEDAISLEKIDTAEQSDNSELNKNVPESDEELLPQGEDITYIPANDTPAEMDFKEAKTDEANSIFADANIPFEGLPELNLNYDNELPDYMKNMMASSGISQEEAPVEENISDNINDTQQDFDSTLVDNSNIDSNISENVQSDENAEELLGVDDLDSMLKNLDGIENEETQDSMDVSVNVDDISNIDSETDDFISEIDDFLKNIEDSGADSVNNQEDVIDENIDLEISSDENNENNENDPLHVLYKKGHVNPKEITSLFSSGAKLPLNLNTKRVLIVAAAVAIFAGSISIVNNLALNKSQNVPADDASLTQMQQENEQKREEEFNQSLPQEQVDAPPATENQMATQMPQPQSIEESMTNAFVAEPVNATITKIAWEIPEKYAYDNSLRQFLQMAGKNLKLNLQNELLLSDNMAYSDRVVVNLVISKDGSLQKSELVHSSGSKGIDKIVLQSVKSTLSYLKMPNSTLNDNSIDATLIINF